MKICKSCPNEVPGRITIDGKRYNLGKRKYCFECSPFNIKSINKNSRKGSDVIRWRQRTKLLAIHHKGGACIRCGYDKCVKALTFHHKDPSQKEFNIAGVTIAWGRIKEELEKCDLLCHNCHVEVHNELDGGEQTPIKEQIQKLLDSNARK